jgi:hypothetical protein
MLFLLERKRPATRLALRRLARQEGTANADKIRQVLSDTDMLDECTARMHDDYEAQMGGTLTDFLTWLLDHSDQLLALVLTLVDLFSARWEPSPAPPESSPV